MERKNWGKLNGLHRGKAKDPAEWYIPKRIHHQPMHTTLPSPSLPPHIPSEDGWSKEMYKNSAAIVRQKAELEKNIRNS